MQNNRYYAVQGHSRSSTDFSTNQKPVCDFLLVNNTNLYPLSHCFQVIADYWSYFRFRQGVSLFNTLATEPPYGYSTGLRYATFSIVVQYADSAHFRALSETTLVTRHPGHNTSYHWWCFLCTVTSAMTTWVTLCHWSVMILDVGDSVQLPVLIITTFRALEPDSIAGPKAWNNLPQSVRSADSLDSFKRKLKFYLFNSCFNVWCVLL